MPRKARQKSSTNIYHVVVRGADRQLIFEDSTDYQKYLQLLEWYKEKLNYKIYAYCLMDNHVHLLIHAADAPLETIFRHLNTSYAIWFNMKYNRTGFLQGSRYYSEPVEDTAYLLNVVRYIHHNPMKAKLESSVGDSYPWSSIHDYNSFSPSLTDTFYILNIFGNYENFAAFHEKESDDGYLDIHSIRRRIPDDIAKQLIFKITNCNTVSDFQKLPLAQRNQAIISIKEKGLSIRQINRLTGIPKGVIERILVTK